MFAWHKQGDGLGRLDLESRRLRSAGLAAFKDLDIVILVGRNNEFCSAGEAPVLAANMFLPGLEHGCTNWTRYSHAVPGY